jgi:hypothetical protein
MPGNLPCQRLVTDHGVHGRKRGRGCCKRNRTYAVPCRSREQAGRESAGLPGSRRDVILDHSSSRIRLARAPPILHREFERNLWRTSLIRHSRNQAGKVVATSNCSLNRIYRGRTRNRLKFSVDKVKKRGSYGVTEVPIVRRPLMLDCGVSLTQWVGLGWVGFVGVDLVGNPASHDLNGRSCL